MDEGGLTGREDDLRVPRYQKTRSHLLLLVVDKGMLAVTFPLAETSKESSDVTSTLGDGSKVLQTHGGPFRGLHSAVRVGVAALFLLSLIALAGRCHRFGCCGRRTIKEVVKDGMH